MKNSGWNEQQQVDCFGCTAEVLKDVMKEEGQTNYDALMVSLSMLSDSQEMIERGEGERARQAINRAKWVIGEVRSELRKSES